MIIIGVAVHPRREGGGPTHETPKSVHSKEQLLPPRMGRSASAELDCCRVRPILSLKICHIITQA